MTAKLIPSLASPLQRSIMIVDDQPSVLRLFERYSISAGWKPIPCSGIEEVKRFLDIGVKPSIVVTDMVLKGATGVAVDELIRRRLPNVPVIFISGYDNVSPRRDSLVLAKTCTPERFVESVDRVIALRAKRSQASG